MVQSITEEGAKGRVVADLAPQVRVHFVERIGLVLRAVLSVLHPLIVVERHLSTTVDQARPTVHADDDAAGSGADRGAECYRARTGRDLDAPAAAGQAGFYRRRLRFGADFVRLDIVLDFVPSAFPFRLGGPAPARSLLAVERGREANDTGSTLSLLPPRTGASVRKGSWN